jgi:hypothetical protein
MRERLEDLPVTTIRRLAASEAEAFAAPRREVTADNPVPMGLTLVVAALHALALVDCVADAGPLRHLLLLRPRLHHHVQLVDVGRRVGRRLRARVAVDAQNVARARLVRVAGRAGTQALVVEPDLAHL